jgi:hypothetical protein
MHCYAIGIWVYSTYGSESRQKNARYLVCMNFTHTLNTFNIICIIQIKNDMITGVFINDELCIIIKFYNMIAESVCPLVLQGSCAAITSL